MTHPYYNSPRGKFAKHKARAKQDSIPFLLTFDEWWDIWQKSGHWEERGRRAGEYCMSRYGDIGPYSVDNVFIQLTTQNTKDAQIGRTPWNAGIPMSDETKQKNSLKTKGRPNVKNQGKIPWNKGLTMPEEIRARMGRPKKA